MTRMIVRWFAALLVAVMLVGACIQIASAAIFPVTSQTSAFVEDLVQAKKKQYRYKCTVPSVLDLVGTTAKGDWSRNQGNARVSAVRAAYFWKVQVERRDGMWFIRLNGEDGEYEVTGISCQLVGTRWR